MSPKSDLCPGPPDYWMEIKTFFLPLRNIIINHIKYFDAFMQQQIDLNFLINAAFWIFLTLCCAFYAFDKIVHEFVLHTSKIKYFQRKQFAQLVWNITVNFNFSLFLYFYNKFQIVPQLSKNQGRYSLFVSSEPVIFYKSQQYEIFLCYSMCILTYNLHALILNVREAEFLDKTATKSLYLMTLIALVMARYENYFIGLVLYLCIYNIIDDCLNLLEILLLNTKLLHQTLFLQTILCSQITAWLYVFIIWLPFKYLVPTLCSQNFNIMLNIAILLWYALSIWNSTVLQYFNHQIYHITTPSDCCGEGSAFKCILLKDSSEHRHFKLLKKAYRNLKLAQKKANQCTLPVRESTSAKTVRAIKYIMTLKRKLKRIREGISAEADEDDYNDNDNEELSI